MNWGELARAFAILGIALQSYFRGYGDGLNDGYENATCREVPRA